MSTLIISEFEVSGSHDCKEQLAPAEIKPTKFNWADDFEDDEEFGSRPEDLLLPSQVRIFSFSALPVLKIMADDELIGGPS